jgi:hypothetical protein
MRAAIAPDSMPQHLTSSSDTRFISFSMQVAF